MRIPVSKPWITELEERYAAEAVASGWVSSSGPFVERAEKMVAEMSGAEHAITTCNGTAALHLALLALDVRPGDEVIVPSLTFVAVANAVRYVGAEPVFVDVDPQTWCIDPYAVEHAITRRTRGIIAVHSYGRAADMDAIARVAPGLWIIEDAAEAHFATYKGRPVGGIGRVGVFSFYGNKIATSVSYETPVLIRQEGRVQLVSIGSLADDFIGSRESQRRVAANLECAAFDSDGGITWRKVTAVHRHRTSPNTRMMRVKTRKGRTVDITPSHSVFKLVDGKIVDVTGRQLKVGNRIVVPRKLNIPAVDRTLDLAEIFRGFDGLKYSDNEVMLKHEGVGGGGGKCVSRYLKITPQFCKLLGYFCAEGSFTSTGCPVFSFGKHEIGTYIADTQHLFSSIWPEFRTNYYPVKESGGCAVVAGGQLHGELFQQLGVGRGSHNKAIPWVVWEASEDGRIAFIEGLLNGDGHRRTIQGVNGECLSQKLKVASSLLANGLHYLLLTLGVQSRISSETSTEGNISFTCEILGEIGKQTNCFEFQGNQLGDVCDLEIKSIERYPTTDFVYDLEVASYENFVGGFGAICLHNSGEGGSLMTSDGELAARARLLRGQGMSPTRRYYFPVVGYNFRMTNVAAALLCAQLERAPQILAERRRVFERYTQRLGSCELVELQGRGDDIAPWMFCALLNGRNNVIENLAGMGIETRPFFHPLHLLPPYRDGRTRLPHTEELGRRGINLPTYPQLTNDEIDEVCAALLLRHAEVRHRGGAARLEAGAVTERGERAED